MSAVVQRRAGAADRGRATRLAVATFETLYLALQGDRSLTDRQRAARALAAALGCHPSHVHVEEGRPDGVPVFDAFGYTLCDVAASGHRTPFDAAWAFIEAVSAHPAAQRPDDSHRTRGRAAPRRIP